MRGWIIVVLVVVGGYLLLVGPPPASVPFVQTVSHYTDPIFLLAFGLFILPGRWVLLHIWSGFFRLTWAEFFHGAGTGSILIDAFAWFFAIVISYFVWVFVLSRLWNLTGRWNPFGWKVYRTRPYFLRAYANLSDWWEREFKFA